MSSLCANIAWAQSASRSQFGVVGGYSVPDADNTNPHQIFGVKGAAFLVPTFSMGGYYLVSSQEEGTGGRPFEYSLHGLEGAYHIPSNTGDTFIALRVGLTKVKTEPTVGEKVIFSPYHFGIAAGYDYAVFPWFVVGFEGHYLHASKSSTVKDAITYQEESMSFIGFLLALQFRL